MNKSSFCSLPWIHLATHPHGGVSLCCESDHSTPDNMARDFSETEPDYKKLHKHSIDEVMNSDYFKSVRLQMLKGDIPKACKGCFDKEAAGVESKRVYENKRYNYTYEKALKETTEDGSIDLSLEFVELRLGNLCNLKCRTCNPESSTKWTSDYKKIQEEVPFVRRFTGNEIYSWPENQNFWDELEKHGDSLKTLYINGGEPTLIKEHWSLLEKLIESGSASQIHLDYSINMTQIPDKAFLLWDNFKTVEIRASIDDLEDRNHYIRNPTKWNHVLNCLQQIKEHPKTNIIILQTIGAMNFFYLDDFYKWAHSQGLHISYNFVFTPDFLGPMAIPSPTRKLILKKLSKTLPKHYMQTLNNLFDTDEDPQLWEKFINYTKVLDRIRKEDFSKTFPEFVQFCKENHTPFS